MICCKAASLTTRADVGFGLGVAVRITPGPIRWHYRHVVNAIVNQAIVE